MHITKEYIDSEKVNGIKPSPVTDKSHSFMKSSWVEKVGTVAGGLMLGYLGLQKLNIANFIVSAGSALFVYRSILLQHGIPKPPKPDIPGSDDLPVNIRQSILINKPREEVYRCWRSLKKHHGVLRHLDEIIYIDGHKRYQWEMSLPTGLGKVQWVAEITEEIENSSISYRTSRSSDISHSGQINFRDIPDGKGTEMQVTIDYYPPVGDIGRGAAKALHAYIGRLILEELERFKHWMEKSTIPEEA